VLQLENWSSVKYVYWFSVTSISDFCQIAGISDKYQLNISQGSVKYPSRVGGELVKTVS